MTNLFETNELPKNFEDSEDSEEELEMSSQNHGVIQLKLGAQLLSSVDEQFNAASEISLDVSSVERQQVLVKCQVKAERELKPDLVLYHTKDLDYIDPSMGADVVRIKTMPLLCIEIVSPKQSSYDIINKFRAYFELGVKSCWFVDPNLKLIKVYSSLSDSKAFAEDGELSDNVLNISLPLSKIFSPRTVVKNIM